MTLPDALKLAGSYLRQDKIAQAESLYAQVLKYKPDSFEAVHMLGFIRLKQGQAEEALAFLDRALAINPDSPAGLMYRGIAARRLNRPEEALASFDRALVLQPDSPHLHNNRGNALQSLERLNDALASYDRALALRPDYVDALNNRGALLTKLRRFVDAVADFDRVIALKPDFADAFHNRGNALETLKRYPEAADSFARALTLKPDHPFALADLANAAAHICDWERRAELGAALARDVREGRSTVNPFVFVAFNDDPALQRECAEAYVRQTLPMGEQRWTGAVRRHDRIRLAYVSPDFRLHAISFLTAGLFEHHDRSRFEVAAISLGPNDGSELRARLIAAFDQFHDVQNKSDGEVAALVRELDVDIAIDLGGFTRNSRPGIFARRPAPIQVNYLGHPGPMGGSFLDYVIADRIVLPFDQQPFYNERIVHLPDSYQVNDAKRDIAEHVPTRGEAGLPQDGFVFCCFNNTYKFTPAMFDVWMRLLHAVEGSVLWLFRENEAVQRNLTREAQLRGIDPSRLVFRGAIAYRDYLAGYRLADLFLDTLPYSAHATASDALWAGLPLVTMQGKAFAGRVAASLLHAVGVPELVTHSLPDYEELALRLARDPGLLRGLRTRLAAHRTTHPLFDTERFARHIEAAYVTMWETWQRGAEPRAFTVEPHDRAR
jgi:predicted O-linked N-acetylglucosamine transferase (SPINDLY family)